MFLWHIKRENGLESVCLKGKIEGGSKGRGRPRANFLDGLALASGRNGIQVLRSAEDRLVFREMVANVRLWHGTTRRRRQGRNWSACNIFKKCRNVFNLYRWGHRYFISFTLGSYCKICFWKYNERITNLEVKVSWMNWRSNFVDFGMNVGNIVSVTTDGALNMIGKNNGFV